MFLNNDFYRMFDSCFNNFYDTPIEPKLKTTKDGSVIFLSLPGFKKSEIDVSFENDKRILTIKAIQEKNEDIHFHLTDFNRSWILPEHRIIEEVELKDGVLILKVKDATPPEKKPIKFEIK